MKKQSYSEIKDKKSKEIITSAEKNYFSEYERTVKFFRSLPASLNFAYLKHNNQNRLSVFLLKGGRIVPINKEISILLNIGITPDNILIINKDYRSMHTYIQKNINKIIFGREFGFTGYWVN
jgi:hypothetical protein